MYANTGLLDRDRKSTIARPEIQDHVLASRPAQNLIQEETVVPHRLIHDFDQVRRFECSIAGGQCLFLELGFSISTVSWWNREIVSRIRPAVNERSESVARPAARIARGTCSTYRVSM